jgi:multicomponent Na+:H+ antiporter subunit D
VAAAALAVLIPMLAGCALAAASPFASRNPVSLALIAAAGLAVVAITVAVPARHGERVIVWFGGWEPRAGVAVGVSFAADTIGAGLAVFVAVLGAAALIVSLRVIEIEHLIFDALAFVFVGAMIGFCLTGDLFNLFVFFELMSVAAYVLVGYEVRRRAALEGALAFAVTNTIGSILLLFGIALLYGRTDALNLAQMGRALAAAPPDALVLTAFALVACGLLVKAAIVPFHLWTADAYAIAPTPICILLAGAFSELGLYGLARVYWTAFSGALGPHADELRAILVAAGALTAVLGAVMCAAQHHLKRMLAFATIAQVGLFLIGLGLLSSAGVAATAVWVVADGLVKASLFACVASLQHRYGSVEVADLYGRGREIWPVGVLFAIGALMIASLPLTGSFLGRSLFEDAALETPGYGWVAALGAVVTGVVAGALLRSAARVFLGLGTRPPRDPAGDADEPPPRESGDRSGTSPLLWAPAALLAAGAIAWGLVPGLTDAVAAAAAAFTDPQAYAAAVLEDRPLAAPPLTLHEPGATAWLYALGSLTAAGAVAAVPMVARRPLPPGPLHAALRAVRRVHNGRLGDYGAWAVAGSAALVAAFNLLLR